MPIKTISAADTLTLRQQILRPGHGFSSCQFAGDNDLSTRHFNAYLEGELIGIVSMFKQVYETIGANGHQLRAMAVAESARGQQIGLKLLRAAEASAFEAGADYIWANARTSAGVLHQGRLCGGR